MNSRSIGWVAILTYWLALILPVGSADVAGLPFMLVHVAPLSVDRQSPPSFPVQTIAEFDGASAKTWTSACSPLLFATRLTPSVERFVIV